jgi:hypothetical protein
MSVRNAGVGRETLRLRPPKGLVAERVTEIVAEIVVEKVMRMSTHGCGKRCGHTFWTGPRRKAAREAPCRR